MRERERGGEGTQEKDINVCVGVRKKEPWSIPLSTHIPLPYVLEDSPLILNSDSQLFFSREEG